MVVAWLSHVGVSMLEKTDDLLVTESALFHVRSSFGTRTPLNFGR
jgi:hypothetical protein